MALLVTVVNVATPAELAAVINAAKAGDEIVLAAGTYRMTGASRQARRRSRSSCTRRSHSPR